MDFYSSPRILSTVEDTIIEAGEQHSKGIEWVLTSEKVADLIEVLRTMGLYEKFRGEDVIGRT
ncbi:hypothetical protein [Arthrobacter sp. KK5.5]|uniref:hypothetical protein n=1 Tax=Arthrobacter sp. KK5.5 TaxID=3373084 RepID=UPI003EE42BD8